MARANIVTRGATLHPSKIKYINNDKTRGIKYDWKAIRKAYNHIPIPDGYFDPTRLPFETAKYLIEYSRRGTGKTTNLLMLGLVMYYLYGTHTIYVRQVADNIAPKNAKDMYGIIQSWHYIEHITNGRWNSITSNAKRWYLCNVDEVGQIIEVDSDHCCFMCDVANASDLKSSFNDPMGDFIIYDEFISADGNYIPNEFVLFCDLLSTIIRQRYSPVIMLVANNIDKEHPFFYEMECAHIVHAQKPGDHMTMTTEKGTDIYIEYYSPEEECDKSKSVLEAMNRLFFGFKNKKLGAITGEDWAITPAQHIPYDKEDLTFVANNLYIMAHDKLVKLDIVLHPVLGMCVYIHWATKTYDDSVILTTEDRFDRRYMYGFGEGRLERLLMKLAKENRFYYASNDIASFVRAYINGIPSTL